MNLKTATLSLAALALIGCDNMGQNRRTADASESSVSVTPPAAAARVVSVAIGRQAGETMMVTEAGTRFGARDTVFLSIVTENAASDSKLSARWTFQDGTVVDSSAENIARSTGSTSAVTQFRIHRDNGWLVGDYKVDIWMNDTFVEQKSFSVQR